MVQQRRNDPSRRRRIKRDLSTIPKKGVAGLKSDDVDLVGRIPSSVPETHDPSEETVSQPEETASHTSSRPILRSLSRRIFSNSSTPPNRSVDDLAQSFSGLEVGDEESQEEPEEYELSFE